MGPHIDAPTGQDLFGNAARHAERGRQTAGKVPAAAHVRLPAPLHKGGIVRVGGPGIIPEQAVIRGTLIRVLHNGAEGRPAGNAVFQAGEKHREIRFPPGGGEGVLPRLPPVQEGVQFLQIHSLARREAVHNHADGLPVGLAKHGDPQEFSKLRGHARHLPNSRSLSRTPDKTSSPPPPPGWSPAPHNGWRRRPPP